VDAVTAGPNPGLSLLGFLITMFNPRLAIHKLYDQLLREQYGAAVLETRVPYAADYKEAIARRMPIADYKPRGASARAIRALADELLARLADAPCSAPAQEAA
jgi:chromosome partitioning protein